ncbi:MAG: polyphosphate kinase [Thermoleophilaceae bacterium]|nr:polyphosphate kinase [Thermoleophilaceae bacterium]
MDTAADPVEITPAPEDPPPEFPPAAERFLNRELSWLDFDERVAILAEDETVPLLERVKFLSIYHTNLDEFFMVRVAGLHDQVEARVDEAGPDGVSPSDAIDEVARRVDERIERNARLWEDTLRPELAAEGIKIVECEECEAPELEAIDRAFEDQIFPALTPLAVGPGRPFPYISNLSLSLAVWLKDPESGDETFARVKVPKEVVPRFVPANETTFVPLESVIARNLNELFPGMDVVRHSVFRVTRDADFTVSDEADDLVRAVENELRRRRFGEVVRLEVGAGMDEELRRKLVEWLHIEERQVYDVPGLMELGDLWDLYEMPGHREVRDAPWTPVTPARLQPDEHGERADVFAAIRAGDLVVHHPYDSFAASVERFVKQAVEDPEVLAIKMTVYRTSGESALIPSLIRAAERGKQAVAMVELKARFDERRNIGWARSLEEAGAQVVHGLPGLKTHAKALMVVRREGNRVRRYVHIGTGNYNAKTARLYEDFGIFTTDEAIADDVMELFNSITGYARPVKFQKAVVSPTYTRDAIVGQIRKTIDAHDQGQDARIVMKMNSLVDPACIDALYEASRAGVRVDLNIRGICCLRPGVEGLSENIHVTSVVGRFLEHSRIYGFVRGDERVYYIGSADLMPRNLDSRVELLIPVEGEDARGEIEDALGRCLADDTWTWELGAGAKWKRRTGRTRDVQRELMERALQRAAPIDPTPERVPL